MEIHLSIAARNRQFSGALRRVSPKVQARLDRVAATELQSPTWETVLVGISDEYAANFIEEIPNNDDLLQLLTGFPDIEDWSAQNDDEIANATLAQLAIAVGKCGLTPNDYDRIVSTLSSDP